MDSKYGRRTEKKSAGPPPRIISSTYSDDSYSRRSYYSDRESGDYSTSTASYEDVDDRRLYRTEPKYIPEVKPSTPPLFAHLFPSTRRLTIKHDDDFDGNMNLRVDTNMSHSSEPPRLITLFHMKMNNLKNRDMVLRRYGRDCGREVVNFRRKYAKPASGRPKLERSGSKLMSSLMGKSDPKDRTLSRQDSGYESGEDDEEELSDVEQKGHAPADTTNHGIPTNTTMLEFSNYAHVDLKRRGSKGSKRYEFEYWGKSYAWKRKITVYGQEESCSYFLVNTATNNIIAHIRPDNLSPSEVAEEQAKGGFVPPSTMWLCDDTDDSVVGSMCDVADVVVATGIYVLVDDSIKRKFSRRKRVVQLVLPTMRGNTVKMNMEYVGPKRLIDQVFNRPGNNTRKNSVATSTSSRTPALIRTTSSLTTTGAPAAERVVSRPAPLRAASTRV
ncbi:hypothetical protein TWF970_010874 [Orbilia oligospora]|uniref:Uncharacterized protein n=1 Tax=Orbilia oligospora TaxID=2813651 RepID=A0A7C8V4F6_ORBOL|nr:hypothetical protein TWF970_010874 [Orbilia oligospora]